jgi:hypothetical protein
MPRPKKQKQVQLTSIEPKIELVETTPEFENSRLVRLLNDRILMQEIADRARSGSSIGTLSAYLKIPNKIFGEWVYRGREECNRYDPEAFSTPYMKLWQHLSTAWADARTIAEATFSKINPEKFLQSKTVSLLGDDWKEDVEQNQEEERKNNSQLDVGANLIEALKTLRQQGLDLNDIIDSNKLSIIVSPPEKKSEDLLEEAGITNRPKYLPGKLNEINDSVTNQLGLKQ